MNSAAHPSPRRATQGVLAALLVIVTRPADAQSLIPSWGSSAACTGLALTAFGFAIAAVVLWRQGVAQDRAFAAASVELTKMEQRLSGLGRQAAARDGQLVQLLETMPEPAALFDDGRRLLAWNRRFAGRVSPPAEPRRGQPAAELLKPPDPADANGSHGEESWLVLADGSRLLRCRSAAEVLGSRPRAAPAADDIGLNSLCAGELRHRLPLLLEACAANELSTARLESHAMRGVAANFGLTGLADALLVVERAALAGQTLAAQAAAIGLPPLVAAGIENLSRRAA